MACIHLVLLNILKEAKELPELFMKSKEEIALWRMLRRLSDRICFELDNRYLDEKQRRGLNTNLENIKDEIADVVIYALLLSHELEIDLEKAIKEKRTKVPN